MSSPAWGMNAGNRQLLSKESFNREKVDGIFGARNPIYRVDLWDGEMPAMYRRAKIAPSVNTVPLFFLTLAAGRMVSRRGFIKRPTFREPLIESATASFRREIVPGVVENP